MFGQVFRCLSLHSVLATASWLHSDPRVLPVYLGNPFFVLVFYVIQHNRWDTAPCSFPSTFGCHERLANVWERRRSRKLMTELTTLVDQGGNKKWGTVRPFGRQRCFEFQKWNQDEGITRRSGIYLFQAFKISSSRGGGKNFLMLHVLT